MEASSNLDDSQSATSPPSTEDNSFEFMDYGLWITTVIFLSLMLASQIISAGLCAFNTATVPIESIVGPMGIYLTNAMAGEIGKPQALPIVRPIRHKQNPNDAIKPSSVNEP